jgi:hypothetical protein
MSSICNKITDIGKTTFFQTNIYYLNILTDIKVTNTEIIFQFNFDFPYIFIPDEKIIIP